MVTMPYLKPSSVLQYLLDTDPWLLLGGLNPGDQAETLLETFWKAYKHEHPTHEVYKQKAEGKLCFRRTIPLLLHGDGARTLKKQPLEVVSLQAALGLDTMEKDSKCHCETPKTYSGCDLTDPSCIRLNSRHNSYLTHFLLFAFPSKKYKQQPGLLTHMLKVTSQDLGSVCTEGLTLAGRKYHFGILGMKGDLEYHAKTGALTRSYQNVGHKNLIMCCHECHAGAPQFPFEDFSVRARWKETLYADTPWDTIPPFCSLPFEPWDSGRAACFFKRDPFHIFRLGIARNLLGSAIILLANAGFFDGPGDSRSVDSRLGRAWQLFSLWAETHRVTTGGIRSFSKEKLHYQVVTSFPWVSCKGSDTVLLLRWLDWFCRLQLLDHPNSVPLKLIAKACANGLQFQGIHRHGIFFTSPSCKTYILGCCKQFCFTYAKLAHFAHMDNATLFSMVPKVHAFAHIYHALEISTGPVSCNPALWDCSMSEDFVGQVARQSRRVSYRNTVENTLLAYKVKARLVIQRFKKSRRM